MKKSLILFILVVVAACAGAPTPLPDEGSEAAGLYAAKCGLCHSLAHPARHTAHQWERMVEVMEGVMADKGMAALTEEERVVILGYLKEHAR
ncbi:MAG: cytochrome C [Thermodesulfobacteriota bacterium]